MPCVLPGLDADGRPANTVPSPAAHEGRFQSPAAAQVQSQHTLQALSGACSALAPTSSYLPPCPLASYQCLDLSCTSRKVRSHSFVVKENLGRAPPSQEDIWSNFLEERMEGKDCKRVLFLEGKGMEQGSALARLFSRIILKDGCIGPGVMFPETRSS